LTASAERRRSQSFNHFYTPTPIGGSFTGKHIVTVEPFARPDLQTLFATATDELRQVRALVGDMTPAGAVNRSARRKCRTNNQDI
jgi:hypothetical protein